MWLNLSAFRYNCWVEGHGAFDRPPPLSFSSFLVGDGGRNAIRKVDIAYLFVGLFVVDSQLLGACGSWIVGVSSHRVFRLHVDVNVMEWAPSWARSLLFSWCCWSAPVEKLVAL